LSIFPIQECLLNSQVAVPRRWVRNPSGLTVVADLDAHIYYIEAELVHYEMNPWIMILVGLLG